MSKNLFPLIFFVLAIAFFAGCSSSSRLKPVNQINEPVFYSKPYAAIGLGLGEQLNFQRDALGPYSGSEEEVLVEPTLSWFYPITGWAGFYLLPTYWTFLLTGDQYDSTEEGGPGTESLRAGKLHLALSGGLSGLTYSGREGWQSEFHGILQAKYRFNDRVFSKADYGKLVFGDFTAAIDQWNLGVGYQWFPTFSVFANYNGAYTAIARYHIVTLNGMDFHNHDILTALGITMPWYVTPKHIVTPEFAYGHRNSSNQEGSFFKASLQYRFVFD